MKRIRIPAILLLLALAAGACNPPDETIEEAELAPKSESTKIFAGDGSLITTLRAEVNREIIPIENIPKHVQDAVVAIEDSRFFHHSGVDAKAILRALYVNATSGKVIEGGSTITQQLVRNAIKDVGREQTVERKIREASTAYQVESTLSKEKILELYLNTVYFGEGAYGIQTASQTYFGKNVGDLALHESALLAGLIKAPVTYNPYTNPDEATSRRNLVLDRMFALGLAPEADVAAAKGAALGVNEKVEAFRYRFPYFVDFITRQIQHSKEFAELGESVADRANLLFRGGLRIYTTIDPTMQAAAEEAVARVLDQPDQDPSASLVAISPKDGHVKALVGGKDFFAPQESDPCVKLGQINADGSPKTCAKVNLALGRSGGGSGRQSGSAFKPFVLAAALEKGMPLAKTYPASACISIPGADSGGPWRVCNYEESSFGSSLNIREATIKSVNVVYAQMIMDVGAKTVVDKAKAMGIGELDRDMGRERTLEAVPSAALGANAVSTFDMASAFTVFPNLGTYVKPVSITKITDSRGNVIWKATPQKRQVLSEAVSYLSLNVMEDVIARGTGARNGKIGRPAFGKTGTAQEWRDGWFVGGAGTDLVAAVSVFWPDAEISMKPSCGGQQTTYQIAGSTVVPPSCRATRLRVAGGIWPTQIWSLFMLKALEGIPASTFPIPEIALVHIAIDVSRGCLPNPYTPEELIQRATFIRGAEPTEMCKEPTGPPITVVPDVKGFPEAEAIKLLQNFGFVVERQERYTDILPMVGRVLEQSPNSGMEVPGGSTVAIVIGHKGVEVPDVLGKTEQEAKKIIEDSGLKVDVKKAASGDCPASLPAGSVCKQKPSAGEFVAPGSTVTIWVKPQSQAQPSPSPSHT